MRAGYVASRAAEQRKRLSNGNRFYADRKSEKTSTVRAFAQESLEPAVPMQCQMQHYLQMPVVFAKLSANMATLCANGSASLCGELRGGRELGANMSRSKSTL